MIKVIFFLKRKPGITHEEFRHIYETSHVKMANKYFGHLMTGYRRNYPSVVRAGRNQGRKPAQFDYDVITEWILPSESAQEEIYRLFSVPAIHQEFWDDEERFLDRDNMVVITSRQDDVVETGTGDPIASLALLRTIEGA